MRTSFVAACLALAVALAVPAAAQNKNDKNQPKVNPAEQYDREALALVVDAAQGGQTANTVPMTWQLGHFLKAANNTDYIPMRFKLDPSQLPSRNVAMYVRVVPKGAAPPPPVAANSKTPPPPMRYPWSSNHVLDVPADGVIDRAVQVPPGEYTLFVAIKPRTPESTKIDPKKLPPVGTVALLQHDFTAPDYSTMGLTTSSLIISPTVEQLQAPLPMDQRDANPYTLSGVLKLAPVPDGAIKLPKSGEINVLFWLYGASAGPDVVFDANVYQKDASGEKVVAKAQSEAVNAQSGADPAQGILHVQSIPLTSFAPGEYRLEMKALDKPSGKTTTQNVSFTVTAS